MKKTVLITMSILLFSSCAFFSQSYKPENFVYDLIEILDETEKMDLHKDYYHIHYAKQSDTGIIFYPGGKVDPLAYLPLLNEIAVYGYHVYLMFMPLDLAVLRIKAADKVLNRYSHENWIIAGHSLGGAMACEYIKKGDKPFQALILLGSYPSSRTDLSSLPIQVLSLREEFGLPESAEKETAVRHNLPENTQFITIPGANHAQFGRYGIQDNDGVAEISADEQESITVELILCFLEQLAGDSK